MREFRARVLECAGPPALSSTRSGCIFPIPDSLFTPVATTLHRQRPHHMPQGHAGLVSGVLAFVDYYDAIDQHVGNSDRVVVRVFELSFVDDLFGIENDDIRPI